MFQFCFVLPTFSFLHVSVLFCPAHIQFSKCFSFVLSCPYSVLCFSFVLSCPHSVFYMFQFYFVLPTFSFLNVSVLFCPAHIQFSKCFSFVFSCPYSVLYMFQFCFVLPTFSFLHVSVLFCPAHIQFSRCFIFVLPCPHSVF